MEKMFILDGSGFLYRAFHAFPPLTSKEGKPMNAIYGFFRMLLKILGDKPDYIIIARDAPVKTKRHEAFEAYKGTRPSMPDDLRQQVKIIKEIVPTLGLEALQEDGYEADDIIATLALKFKETKDVKIYSADKDLKRLLDKNVTIMDPNKDEPYTVEHFHAEFGFEPQCMVDYLALMGDVSDNIPGLPGVGPKTACELIKKYCTIEAIYEHLDELKPQIKEKFENHRETLKQSKGLVEMIEVPMLCNYSAPHLKTIDRNIRRTTFSGEYNFPSFERLIAEMKAKCTTTQTSLFG